MARGHDNGADAVLDLGDSDAEVGLVTLDGGGTITGTGTLTSDQDLQLFDGTVDVTLAGTGIKLVKDGPGTVTLQQPNRVAQGLQSRETQSGPCCGQAA